MAQPTEQAVDPRGDRAVAGQRAPVGASRLAQGQELPNHPVDVGEGTTSTASVLVVAATASTTPSSAMARTRCGNRLA